MEYTIEQIDQVGAGLLALPALDASKRKLDKQAAVRRIKGDGVYGTGSGTKPALVFVIPRYCAWRSRHQPVFLLLEMDLFAAAT